MPVTVTRILHDALRQLEAQKARITSQITAVRAALDGRRGSEPVRQQRRQRGMSSAQRAEVSRRMKAYWKKWRAGRKGKPA